MIRPQPPPPTGGALKATMKKIKTKTPDPVPPGYLRDLIESAGITQGQAARIAHVLPQTLRRWLLDPSRPTYRAPPWAVVELIRQALFIRCHTPKKPADESRLNPSPISKTSKTPKE